MASDPAVQKLAAQFLRVGTPHDLERFLRTAVAGADPGMAAFVGSPVGRELLKALRSVAASLLTIGRAGRGGTAGAPEGEIPVRHTGRAGFGEEELEVARRFVRVAQTSARSAARASHSAPPRAVAMRSLATAARRHAPTFSRAPVRSVRPLPQPGDRRGRPRPPRPWPYRPSSYFPVDPAYLSADGPPLPIEEPEPPGNDSPPPGSPLADGGAGDEGEWEGEEASAIRIQDRTALTPKQQRKGTRAPGTVYALVLHQMAFSRGSNPTRYDTVTAHFAILPDGTILQLHPVSALLWASNGFNRGSVAVEFAGNFPNIRGRCWAAARFGCHRVTDEQIEAGRFLIDHLIRTIGLTHVLAHRQSSGTRENDPGPDIWYHVGEWAVKSRNLRDGGPGFKVGTGNPILPQWRTWGEPGNPGFRGMTYELEGEYGGRFDALQEIGDEMQEPKYGSHDLREVNRP